MNQKISDFKLAECIIKAFCKIINANFVNLEVIFDKDKDNGYFNGRINVGKTINVAHTINNIVTYYLLSSYDISGFKAFKSEEHKSLVLNCLCNFLRSIAYCKIDYKKDKSNILSRLSDFPAIYIIMKDIICPAYRIQMIDFKVLEMDVNNIDIASFIGRSEEIKHSPFIFLNSGIEESVCRESFLLTEAIRGIGKCPIKTLKEIYDTDIKEQMFGVIDLEYKDVYKFNTFDNILRTINEIDNKSDNILLDFYNKNIKTSQAMDNKYEKGSSWWLLGLLEKMISPARGSDWTTFLSLQPYFKELWDKIEIERAKRGREGITYEKLLRIQNGENEEKSGKIIEKILCEDRIW